MSALITKITTFFSAVMTMITGGSIGSGETAVTVNALTDTIVGSDLLVLGVIAVPAAAAQEACNLLCESGVKAIWCFAPCRLYKPADVIIQYENLALSLAHLKMQIRSAEKQR